MSWLVQTGNAELVQAAEVPLTPSSPNKRRNAMMGVLVGLLLGIALAFLLDRLDRRLRDPKEVEELLNRPVLAAVPKSRALSRESLERMPLLAVDAEAFRMLRANLRYFNVDQDIRSVLITSSASGDGKSIVSWNLAATAAGAGLKALLIEADLRHPALPRRPAEARRKGLSAVLSGNLSTADATIAVPIGPPADNGASEVGPTVDVLFAGAIPPNPTDLIESDRMKELIREAERTYDLVVIALPPPR